MDKSDIIFVTAAFCDTSEKVFRYIRHHKISDYLLLGWMPYDSLNGTPHEQYSILMEFRCVCGREP